MAQLMNDEQRLEALEAYNPKDHLISVGKNKDGSAVLYYPAAWRLYELRLRHPNFTLEAEILHMDESTVIIKAIGYDGLDYASSKLKGTALKQGKLFELDKVETKAKSRVARDIGIGTEYALDMTSDETDATHSNDEPPAQITSIINAPTPAKLRKMFIEIGKSLDLAQKLTFKGIIKPEDNLTPEECHTLKQVYDNWKKALDEKAKAS